MLFRLTTAELLLFLFTVILGATALGAFLGRRMHHLSDKLSEPFGVLNGAMLGVVGLILAFGLSLALSRYEDRRDAIVVEAAAIDTTYLRAQTLPEPERSRSLDLLVDYTESALLVSNYIPHSDAQKRASGNEQELQRRLWRLAGRSLADQPVASAPRLYVESLNEMIDAETARLAALNNQVPIAVLLLEIVGACIALGLLAAYLALIGRGLLGVLLASLLVAILLFITADLDRPTRGPIQVPDTVLVEQLEEMQLPPAAPAP